MATSLALSAASSGAWGANVRPDIDALGCYLFKVNKLQATNEGFFLLPIPMITSKEHLLSKDTAPLAGVHLREETPTLMHGIATGNATGNNEERVSAHKARGLYRISRISDATDKGNSKISILIGKKVHVNLLFQPFKPGEDLFLRPEIAFYPDTNAQGSLRITDFLTFQTMIDGGLQKSLNKSASDITLSFTNNFTANCSDSHAALKLFSASDTRDKSVISLWSVIADSDDNVFVTFHFLLKEETAKTCREHLCLAYLRTRFNGFSGDFKSIYLTDTSATANLTAYGHSLGMSIERLQETLDPQKTPIPPVKALIDRQWQGVNAVLGYFWNVDDNDPTRLAVGTAETSFRKHLKTVNPIFWH